MTSESLVPELFKELGRMQGEIERLRMQIERQSQTIRDQAEIVDELRGELNARKTN